MRSTAFSLVTALALLAVPLAVAAEEAPPDGRRCAVADCLASVVEMFEKQGWLGLELEWIPSRGLRVARVVEGGPADAAGVRAADAILAIGGQPVDTKRPETVQPLLTKSRPGEVTELRIRRGDDLRTVRVRAAAFPPQRLKEAIGAYVLGAIHLCHHPDEETVGHPPTGGKPRREGGRR